MRSNNAQRTALPQCDAVAMICSMNSGRRSLRLLVAMAVVCGAPPAICLQFLGGDEISLAQASLRLPHENTFELQESLFVQDPHLEGAKGGIQVLWIPQP